MLFRDRDVEKGQAQAPMDPATGSRPAPAPTPASASRPAPLHRRLGHHLLQDIHRRRADLVLLTCSYIAGLCDSGTFNAWSCFVSMQTGNTIFLGLGAAGLPAAKPYGWLRSLVAILAFCAGCVVFARSRHARPRSRATLAVSFGVQALCLTVAAIILRTGWAPGGEDTTPLTPGENPSFRPLLPIALLAFQGGGQVWTGDVLGFREIPTTVLTSIYFGLAADPRFWQPAHNAPRNRRLAAVAASLLGAISAGWLSRSRAAAGGGIPAIFFVAAGLKYGIALAWLVWPAEPTTEPEPEPVEEEPAVPVEHTSSRDTTRTDTDTEKQDPRI